MPSLSFLNWILGQSGSGCAQRGGSRQSAFLCAQDRHSIMPGTPLRFSSTEKQVRAGRLQFGAIRTAHANCQSVCSADPARRAHPW
jgi:hypothetical protein